MNNETEEMIERLSFENYIWIVFIIIAILDIYGDELIKNYLRYNDLKADKLAKKIFLWVTIISIIIYIYFVLRNYYDYKKHENNEAYQIRLFGSILILTGTICLLYFQVKTTVVTNSPSNI